eukprot:278509-Pyramimonas_sp.AAC.1
MVGNFDNGLFTIRETRATVQKEPRRLGENHIFPTLALPRRVLTLYLKGAGQWEPARAVPPVSAPRFPQLRPP